MTDDDPIEAGTDVEGEPARRSTIESTHDDPETVAAALRPDNTVEMTTRVEGDRVVTTIERGDTAGLHSTVDDYLVNLAVADRAVETAGTAPSGAGRSIAERDGPMGEREDPMEERDDPMEERDGRQAERPAGDPDRQASAANRTATAPDRQSDTDSDTDYDTS